MKAKVGIVGYRGYSGAELVRILARHPGVEPYLLEHREESGPATAIRGAEPPECLPCDPQVIHAEGLAVVFLATPAEVSMDLARAWPACLPQGLATPAEVSMDLAPAMLDAGARVIDLSGAFRLRTPANYLAWYKETHTQPALLAEAVYGLPEFYRDLIPGARLVANPGCYPAAANLAIRPLLEADAVDRTSGIVCYAKSGVSGAGRKPTLKTSFCEVTENFSAYSILRHRHVPEVL